MRRPAMIGRRMTRRQFLNLAGAAGLAAARPWPVLEARRGTFEPAQAPAGPWASVDAILARIVPPKFPARDFDVSKYGAVGNGTTPCTAAFRAAVAACHAAGGGRVLVPPGRFLTGPIHLLGRVDLHVSEGATILFSRDTKDYLPLVFTRWEGVELMNYSPLVYAFGQEDVAVTGGGTLDGNADEACWWPWKGTGAPPGGPNQAQARARLMDLAERGVPVAERIFGEGSFLRPNFIQFYRCANVLIEGVRIVNSPMWEIHPVLCSNVTIRKVTVDSHGPNNDGCDPESCRDVLVEDCTFDTGDDCIALKSGRNADGRRLAVPVENIVIRDCTMKDGHGGVVIGSEMSGGARNVFVERCRMDSPQLDRALRIKTNSVRGGFVENVFMRDVTIGQVAEAVVTIDYFYEEGDSGAFPPLVRNVELRNVSSRKSRYGLLLRGYGRDPVRDVRLVDCRFENVAEGDVVEGVEDLVFRNVVVNGKVRNDRITAGAKQRKQLLEDLETR
ncbi:MAG: glycoside hydrolase family 28 protein [Vicinamibacterales bacterium]